jgi:transposase-like protein
VLRKAIHLVLGLDAAGKRDVLGLWVAEGAEGAMKSLVFPLDNKGVIL